MAQRHFDKGETQMTTKEIIDHLEGLIDNHGIDVLLWRLRQACVRKSIHAQDEEMAAKWSMFAEDIRNIQVPRDLF